MVGIDEAARLAGVSTATVSRAHDPRARRSVFEKFLRRRRIGGAVPPAAASALPFDLVVRASTAPAPPRPTGGGGRGAA